MLKRLLRRGTRVASPRVKCLRVHFALLDSPAVALILPVVEEIQPVLSEKKGLAVCPQMW